MREPRDRMREIESERELRGVDAIVARGDARVPRRGEDERVKTTAPVAASEKPGIPASFGVARDRGESECRRR